MESKSYINPKGLFAQPHTNISDCEIYAVRQVIGDVNDAELLEAFKITPNGVGTYNNYGIYHPIHVNLETKKAKIEAANIKKLIISKNQAFIKSKFDFIDDLIINKFIEVKLDFNTISYYAMVIACLNIMKKQNLIIKLKIKFFLEEKLITKEYFYTDIVLFYTAINVGSNLQYVYNPDYKLDGKKVVAYEVVVINSAPGINLNEKMIKICRSSFEKSFDIKLIKSDLEKECFEKVKNDFIEKIKLNGGLEFLLLCDAAAHKQFTGKGLDEANSFNLLIEKIKTSDNKKLTEIFNIDDITKQKEFAVELGVCMENPSLFYLTHVFTDIDSAP